MTYYILRTTIIILLNSHPAALIFFGLQSKSTDILYITIGALSAVAIDSSAPKASRA